MVLTNNLLLRSVGQGVTHSYSTFMIWGLMRVTALANTFYVEMSGNICMRELSGHELICTSVSARCKHLHTLTCELAPSRKTDSKSIFVLAVGCLLDQKLESFLLCVLKTSDGSNHLLASGRSQLIPSKSKCLTESTFPSIPRSWPWNLVPTRAWWDFDLDSRQSWEVAGLHEKLFDLRNDKQG